MRLEDAAGEERIEMHGEIVGRGAAGFRDVFRARAGLGVEKSGNVTDFDFFFGADFDNAVTGRNRGNDWIEVTVDANFRTFCGVARPTIGVADGKRGDPDVVLGRSEERRVGKELTS